jgi:hypothetical protein
MSRDGSGPRRWQANQRSLPNPQHARFRYRLGVDAPDYTHDQLSNMFTVWQSLIASCGRAGNLKGTHDTSNTKSKIPSIPRSLRTDGQVASGYLCRHQTERVPSPSSHRSPGSSLSCLCHRGMARGLYQGRTIVLRGGHANDQTESLCSRG